MTVEADIMKFDDTDEKRFFVSSDWHLNHEGPRGCTPLWESRGYSSPKDMTNGIIDTVNSTVRPDDVILYAGDFCLNTPPEQFDGLLNSIKCKNIYMLFGNHNNPHYKGVYRKKVKSYGGLYEQGFRRLYPVYHKNIVYMGDYMEFVWNGQFVTFFHYPIWEWNNKAGGAWMIHGHSHYTFDPGRATNKTAKILDVSWDGHGRPLMFETVKAIMDTKGIPTQDHHVPDSKRLL